MAHTPADLRSPDSAAPEPLIACRQLPMPGSIAVDLPPTFAVDAALKFFTQYLHHTVQIGDGAGIRLPNGQPLPDGMWIVVCPLSQCDVFSLICCSTEGGLSTPHTKGKVCWLLFPRHTLYIRAIWESRLREALYRVTPERRDARGLPLPWVAARPPEAALDEDRPRREDDVVHVADGPPLPASTAAPASRQTRLDSTDDDSMQQALWALCARAGLGQVPLQVRRPTTTRDGFVAGWITLAPSGPRQIRVEIDPNADAAEVWATLLHEVAHALTPRVGHSEAFQRRLVDLAGAVFGTRYLVAASGVVGTSFATVDAWIAVCVRAALRDGDPPMPEAGDEGSLARVVGRVQKLRRLARRHPGTPESIAACAKANDILVRWDLGSYQVRLDAGIDEQMCDRWVDVGRGSVWFRQLSFVVARFCGVFALSRAEKGWMHFFGRYADVITAEWFFEIWRDHIERTCEAHLQTFRARRARGEVDGNVRSERTNFCDSAVLGIDRKLKALLDDSEDIPPEARRQAAEHFAGEEFQRRGLRWGGGSGKAVTVSAEGLAAGAAAPMGRGVGGPGGVKGLLGD